MDIPIRPGRRVSHSGRILLLLSILLGSGLVFGAEDRPAEDRPADAHSADGHGRRVVVDPAITLVTVIDHAFEQAPARGELLGRLAEAQVWSARASAWLGNTPAFSMRYQTDQFNSNNGIEEYEAGVELPLWRFGERRATRAFASSSESAALADTAALRWSIAGRVRELLWDLSAARFADDAIAEELVLARDLVGLIERQHALGEIAETDLLLARSVLLDLRNREIQSHAALFDVEREYLNFTRLSVQPPMHAETRSEQEELSTSHPLLAQADAHLRSAAAASERVRQAAGGSPTLLVGPKQEQAAFDPFTHDSLGVTFRLPIAGSVHNRTTVAAADSALAAAQAQRDLRIRELELRLHEAEHALMVLQERAGPVHELAELAERQLHMSRRAYEAGELSLPELIRIQQSALTARLTPARLAIEEGRQLAMYNQALGEVP